jgi:hypothetical protein
MTFTNVHIFYLLSIFMQFLEIDSEYESETSRPIQTHS